MFFVLRKVNYRLPHWRGSAHAFPWGKVLSAAKRMRGQQALPFCTFPGELVRFSLIRHGLRRATFPQGKALVRCLLATLNDNLHD